MIQILLWICSITAFTVFCSWYAKKYKRADALIGLYIAIVVLSLISATKIGAFDLGVAKFFAPSGVLFFSVTFLLTDIVNERFGRYETHRMIFIAFLSMVAVSFFSWLTISVEPAPFWKNQIALESILGQIPRVVLAGWAAFLTSENLDAYIFDLFKKLTKGKHLWARNVFSSFPSMAVDSIVFVIVAFYGLQPIFPIIGGLIIIKWVVGLVDIPFMYLNRWILYKEND